MEGGRDTFSQACLIGCRASLSFWSFGHDAQTCPIIHSTSTDPSPQLHPQQAAGLLLDPVKHSLTHTHTDSLATCFLYLDLVNRMSLSKIILLKCACVMGSVVFAVWSSCFHWSVELITQRETLERDSFTRIRFYSVRYWYVTFTLFTHSESLNWLQFGISIDAF